MALALPGPTARPHPEWPQGPLVSSHPVHAWSDNPLSTPDVGSKVLILVCSASICSPSPASGGERPAVLRPASGPERMEGSSGVPRCHPLPRGDRDRDGTYLPPRPARRRQGAGAGAGAGPGRRRAASPGPWRSRAGRDSTGRDWAPSPMKGPSAGGAGRGRPLDGGSRGRSEHRREGKEERGGSGGALPARLSLPGEIPPGLPEPTEAGGAGNGHPPPSAAPGPAAGGGQTPAGGGPDGGGTRPPGKLSRFGW